MISVCTFVYVYVCACVYACVREFSHLYGALFCICSTLMRTMVTNKMLYEIVSFSNRLLNCLSVVSWTVSGNWFHVSSATVSRIAPVSRLQRHACLALLSEKRTGHQALSGNPEVSTVLLFHDFMTSVNS